jgi:EKC/KEOPS complex subunit CGI121/TPRKB
LGENVKGTSVELGEGGEELGEACEVDQVRKVYKLSDGGKSGKGKKGAVVNGDVGVKDERKEMESVVLGIIALKGS